MKILHLPDSTGQQAFHLSRGEIQQGHLSHVLYKQKNWLNYKADIQLNLQNINRVSKAAALANAFIKIRDQYDIYHFNQGQSLLHFPGKNLFHLDLPYYPKSKKLFVTYQGCDARQKYPTMDRQATAACHNKDCYQGQCNSGRLDRLRQKSIIKMSQYVDHMWAVNPDLLHFLPQEKSSFLPYAIQAESKERPVISSGQKALTIVHAPTNRAAKGSKFIIEAVNRLKNKYPDQINFICVENTPHKESLEIYKKADLVIDQILIGWYGAFAVENMLMGKPVIARIEESVLNFIPQPMREQLRSSVISANPLTLYSELEKLISNKELLRRYAQNGYEYAQTWHSPDYVAKLTLEKYAQ